MADVGRWEASVQFLTKNTYSLFYESRLQKSFHVLQGVSISCLLFHHHMLSYLTRTTGDHHKASREDVFSILAINHLYLYVCPNMSALRAVQIPTERGGAKIG